MSRVGDYEALGDYLDEVRQRPFAWHAWDCLHFVDGAWLSCWGTPLAGLDVRKKVTKGGLYKRRDQLSETFGHDTLQGWLNTVARHHRGLPVRGSAVLVKTHNTPVDRLIGFSFGVSVGSHVATVGRSGVAYISNDAFCEHWTPK